MLTDLAAIFPALAGANPLAVAALADAARKYPANDNSIGDGLNTAGYRFNARLRVSLNSHTARFDFNLTSKQQLSAPMQIQQDLIGGERLFPDTPPQDTWSHPFGFVVGHTWTISWNSGLPFYSPYDTGYATNWNIQSNGVRLKPVQSCPTRGSAADPPSLFGCDRTYAFQSWRNAKPGETGDRNVIRLLDYVSLDLGLAKSFQMPWSENHRLQVLVEAFNVTNT